MDPALKNAAVNGDVKFLKEAVSVQPWEYFLTQTPITEDGDVGGNILHLSAWDDKLEFFKETADVLPAEILKQLLSQTNDKYRWTPLHAAAAALSYQRHCFVKLIKQMYASFDVVDDGGQEKPWLALSTMNRTPLHLSLTREKTKNENSAMELLLMDSEFASCAIVDKKGNTPLFYALKNGFNTVAEMILLSSLSSESIFRTNDVLTPFSYATNCSDIETDSVVRLLFKRYGDWMEKTDSRGFSVLHQWAENGEARPCKLLLDQEGDVGDARTKIFKHCIFLKENERSDTPLHIAVRMKDSELGQILVRGYQQQVSVGVDEVENQELIMAAVECPPWKIKNINGNTPLHASLSAKHEEFALEILSIDPTSCKIRNKTGESPFFLAVMYGCTRVVDDIMRIEEPRFDMLHRNDGTTVLHMLSSCPEKTGRMLLEKYWWIISLRDDKGKTALDYAKQANALWLVNLLSNPHLIQKQRFDWIEACKREEALAVLALVDNCQDLQRECREQNDTPLFYALKNGFNTVAEKILLSSLSSESIFRTNDVLMTPFSYATNCSDSVVRLLFKRYGDWMEKTDSRGFSVLHQWAENGEARPCKLLLDQEGDVGDARTKIFKHCIFLKENERSDTPLHIAVRMKDSELGQILVRGYQQQVSVGVDEVENQELIMAAVECPPWKIKNINGNTPLHASLSAKHEEFALEILSIDPTSCKIRNKTGESPFFLAVMYGCTRVVDDIMRIEEPRFDMLCRNDGTTVLHMLSSCPEKTGRMLLEKYWWIISLRDDKGKTALDYAKQANALWLVNLLSNPHLIQKQRFDWIEACKREEALAVLAFVDNYQDLQRECREQNDTPLHHIKLPTYKDYLNFLKIPSIAELKNSTDRDGATALHRALERKDMLLAKALLLDDGVERTISDHNGTTAMDLLIKLYKENDDWEKMCKLIKVNPYLKTSYIKSGTNLEQIRNTLSVVAALLATITFAAGFTIPGGINNNTGEALLAKKAAFTVFLLADAYAMCTSMLVLFCLIWSMVSEPDMARLLVDRSVFILMQSLYGTLLAFMTGIYCVIEQGSLWAAIVIFVMCSIIGISANRTILHNLIAKLVPAANREKKDPLRLLEEGSAGASSTEKDSSCKTE